MAEKKMTKLQQKMETDYKSMRENEEKRIKYIQEATNKEDKIAEILQMQADKLEIINKLKANQDKLTADQKAKLAELTDEYDEQVKQLRLINAQTREQQKNQDALNKRVQRYSDLLAKGWEYLMQSDKTIKETIRNLGMSGAKAAAMRTSFELSAGHVARMGGSLADIQNIMQGYAEETGRARAMSAQMVEDITAVGLGTGLGVEQATKLGAQFEIMGFDARKTVDYVQGIVDTSERMGVNTTKVLRNINDNFKRVNTYSFKSGSKGIAEMAMNAEKMKVDMKDALSAADAGKSLEKAIDLAANLQVMGGEFAKTDPLEWMYLARNEPDKLTKKISEMTRGMVTFRKNSDGTFEKFISPEDRQRMEAVAKSLGISAEEMTQITQRRADLDKMSRELAGTGLTDREKELVQGAAIFNAKSGKFEVQLAGKMRDIATLTQAQAESFTKEQTSLKDRAEAAQDFETAFKATIEEFKAAFLPMLKGINMALSWIRPIAKAFNDAIAWMSKSDTGNFILKGAGMLLAAGFLLNKAAINLTRSGKSLGERLVGGGGGEGKGGGIFSRIFSKKTPEATSTIPSPTGSGAGGGMFSKMTGKGMMQGGAGIGAAALGMGAGIGLAAVGISKLADSLSKLTPEQAKTLTSIVKTLGWFVVGGAIAAAAVLMLGTAMGAAAPPMGAFALAALGIGAAIGIAAVGIGLMSMGLAKLVESSKGAGKDMMQVGVGIAAIGAALAMAGFGGGMGLVVLSATLGVIALSANKVARVGESFEKIGVAIKGSKEDFVAVANAVNSISKANVGGGGMLAELATLLKSPLKVEFADKNVAVVSNITMQIDGHRIFEQTYNAGAAIQKQVDLKGGKAAK